MLFSISIPTVALGDYAANTGTTGVDVDLTSPLGVINTQNGAFRAAKGVRIGEITDGTGATLMIGEKHVPPILQAKYPWDWSLYDGHNPASSQRAAGPQFPIAASDSDLGWKFGSAHPGICQFVFCDGTVRALSNSIDPYVLGLLAQRNDGCVVPEH